MTQQELFTELIPEFFFKPPSYIEAREILEFVGQSTSSEAEDLSLEIKKEFTRFFTAPGEHKLPPYESYWVLKKQEEDPINAPRLYSRTTTEVKEIYEQLGIQILEKFHQPPDHIAFELSVFFTLVNSTEVFDENLKNLFIEEHILRWIPDYLSKLADKQGYFYPVIAQFLLKEIFNQTKNV